MGHVDVISHFCWRIASRTPSRGIRGHRDLKERGLLLLFAHESIMRRGGGMRWKLQFIKYRGWKGSVNATATATRSSAIRGRFHLMTTRKMVQCACIRLLHNPCVSLSCMSHIHFQNVASKKGIYIYILKCEIEEKKGKKKRRKIKMKSKVNKKKKVKMELMKGLYVKIDLMAERPGKPV